MKNVFMKNHYKEQAKVSILDMISVTELLR